MQHGYYILQKAPSSLNHLPVGCIFELSNKVGSSNIDILTCLDNNKICDRIKSIIDSCLYISRRCALLLLGVIKCSERFRLLENGDWSQRSKLDVGDCCEMSLSGQFVRVKIKSKQLNDKGAAEFTVLLDNGRRLNVTIDKINVDKSVIIRSQSQIAIEKPLVKERPKCLNIDLVKSLDTEKKITKPQLVSSSLNQNQTEEMLNVSGGLNCKCIPNLIRHSHLFEKDQSLQNADSKELFIRQLLNILLNTNYSVTKTDIDGRNALHWGALYLLIEPIIIILNNEEEKSIIDSTDINGNTPLHLCIASPLASQNSAKYKKNLERTVLLLLAHGADVTIKNRNNETIITKIFKSGYFWLLEKLLINLITPLILNKHRLADGSSILECLIKMKKFPLANICIQKCTVTNEDNEIFLKATYIALCNNNKELALIIFNKFTEQFNKDEKMNEKLLISSCGETFLTYILKETSINNTLIWDFITSSKLDDYNLIECNNNDESPLELACSRLFLELIIILLRKLFNKDKLNDQLLYNALETTMTSYSEYYVNQTYKNNSKLYQLIGGLMAINGLTQIKKLTFDIINEILKSRPNFKIEMNAVSVWESVEACADTEFSHVIRHLLRMKCDANSSCNLLSPSPTTMSMRRKILEYTQNNNNEKKSEFFIDTQGATDSSGGAIDGASGIVKESTNLCLICMDEPVNCSYECGHTSCFTCANKIYECHTCRQPIKEKRRIYLP